LRFHILASASAGERIQQFHSVTWDVDRRLLSTIEEVPQPEAVTRTGRALALTRQLEIGLESVRLEIIRRMRKPISRLQRRARSLLEERMITLGSYYRGRLQEEGERRGGNLHPQTADVARRLKLEWERKISAERESLRLRGSLRIVALEELTVPRSRVQANGTLRYLLLFDHSLGRFIEQACTRCGMRSGVLSLNGRTNALCRRCERVDAMRREE
jgi:hypothetical protein